MKKINRLLAVLLAFTVVITTFSSDFTAAHVYATETETSTSSDDEIKTADWESTDEEVVSSDASTEESTEVVESEVAVENDGSDPKPSSENANEGYDGDIIVDENDLIAVEGSDIENPEGLVDNAEATTDYSTEATTDEKSLNKPLETVVGNVKITVKADEGVLPDDAWLDVNIVYLSSDDQESVDDKIEAALSEDVEDKEVKVQQTINFDINIYADSLKTDDNRDGKFQPEDGTVSVEFSNISELAEAATDSDTGLAVFHVTDDLSAVNEEAKIDNTTDDEIAFEASHFSIYAVTMYYYVDLLFVGYEGDVSFNAGVYDLDGKEIDAGSSIRKIYMDDTGFISWGNNPAEVAPIINGYEFSCAKIDEKEIIKFYLGLDGVYAKVKDGKDVKVNPSADEAVKMYYSKVEMTTYTTSSHIDLGFTDTEFATIESASVSINGEVFNLGRGIDESDLGVKELRLTLPADNSNAKIDTVSSDDKIVFTVSVYENGTSGSTKTYVHKCKTSENIAAYERCINAHTYRQEKFGFDYKFDFTADFSDDDPDDVVEDEKVGFYLLNPNADKPGPGGQNPIYYYPADSARDWPGAANSMDTLKPTDTFNDGAYRAVYHWGGIDQNEVGYSYDEYTKGKIDSYIKEKYGSDFSEADVVWYVYKKQSLTASFNHIDGYVSTDITYYANNGTGQYEKISTYGDDNTPIRWGSKLKVAANTFTNGNKVFLGWKDEEGNWYGTNDTNKTITANGRIKLYAQWSTEVEYRVNYIVQGSDGSFSHRVFGWKSEYNYYKRVNYKLQVNPDDLVDGVEVSAQDSDKFDATHDLAYTTNENLTQTEFSKKFKAYGVGYTVTQNEKEKLSDTITADGKKIELYVFFTRDDLGVKLEVRSLDQEWVYDGKWHSYDKEQRFTYSNEGNENLVVTDVKLDGFVKNVSDTKAGNNKISVIYVTDKSNGAKYTYYVNKNGQVYNKLLKIEKGITVRQGTLTINPKKVTLASDTISKKFDGKVLVNGDTPLKINTGFVEGEYVTVKFTGAQLDINNEGSDNSFTIAPGVINFGPFKLPVIDLTNYKFVSASKEGKVYTEADEYTGADGKKYRQYGDFGKLIVTGDPEKSIVKISVSLDGKNEKTVTYNGLEQEVKPSVVVSHHFVGTTTGGTGETEANNANGVNGSEVTPTVPDQASLFEKLLSFGTLKACAAEETDIEYTFNMDDKDIDTTFYVTGIKLVGGSGTPVGDYYVTLDKSKVKVQTKDASGNYTDFTDQFNVIIDTPKSAEGKTSDKGEIAGVLHIVPAHVTVTASTGLSKTEGASDPVFSSTLVVDDDNLKDIKEEQRAKLTAEANSTVAHKVTREPGEATGKYKVKIFDINDKEYTEDTVIGNFKASFVPGEFTINSGSSEEDDDDDTPDNPDTVEFVPLTAAPAAPAVLGIQRELVTGDVPAVLGARRAPTDDTDILGSIITIIVAAAIAFSMVFIKRKKKEEN